MKQLRAGFKSLQICSHRRKEVDRLATWRWRIRLLTSSATLLEHAPRDNDSPSLGSAPASGALVGASPTSQSAGTGFRSSARTDTVGPTGEGAGWMRPGRARSPESMAGVQLGLWWATLFFIIGLFSSFAAEMPIDHQPQPGNASEHAFPALGAVANRKVNVEWNRFYDAEGLGTILANLHQAFPQLTKLYSIGTSVEGRALWCLEVTAFDHGEAARKPGMYIDGNIHGNEVQGGEVVAYTAWYLCHQYGRLATVTDLLEHNVFYLVPTINPDARDYWFHHQANAHWPRSGFKPVDNDHDGVADEDNYDDLDGDGSLCQMRIKDSHGRWKAHPDYPNLLMVRAADDEPGEYTLLGWEGIDNDNDGRINEDPPGGYDMNRDWAWDWEPSYIQQGAMAYPFSLPETRAVAEFVSGHPNIAAMQSYHNAMGAILRSPGRKDASLPGADERVLRFLAERGEKMLPFYRSMVTGKELYQVYGGEFDWFYRARGILGFTTELWTMRNLDKGTNAPTKEDQAAFVKYVLLNDGAVKWHPFNHPTYGQIEIGGFKKNWGRVPPSFLLEEECHRNMAFTLYHASQMPRLRLAEVATEKLDDGLFKVRVTIENTRLMPTRTAQDVQNHISSPDVVTLSGPQVKVLAAGRVTDRFFNRVEAVKRRPERVELDTIAGLAANRVQFIVSGSGRFQVAVNSAKGGVLREERDLP